MFQWVAGDVGYDFLEFPHPAGSRHRRPVHVIAQVEPRVLATTLPRATQRVTLVAVSPGGRAGIYGDPWEVECCESMGNLSMLGLGGGADAVAGVRHREYGRATPSHVG